MTSLEEENRILRQRIAELEAQMQKSSVRRAPVKNLSPDSHLTFLVFGASGDLAFKKTFPSLLNLWNRGFLPPTIRIVGFARTELTDEQFRARLKPALKEAKADEFLKHITYFSGQYSSLDDFAKLNKYLSDLENGSSNRIFYMAIPPSVFLDVGKGINAHCIAPLGYSRVVIEKPFGRDLETSRALATEIANLFPEEQLFRIDHYLGKEMVQNLLSLRFGNAIFEPLWNRHHVSNVQIVFKEDFGTEGRGGYFDQFGIIRDVMQNHLTQVFCLLAMEPPVSSASKDVRDEKVKILRATVPIDPKNVVVGQYVAANGQAGYKDDEGVPSESNTPTFCTAVVFVNNNRWQGVPFIFKAGKALNERKAEVRIQFRRPASNLYPSSERNELVLRLQPNEAVYLKLSTKVPGLSNELSQTELDLTYKDRFNNPDIPDAYARLIYDVIRGDRTLFVRDDELDAAWQLWSPLLHHLETKEVAPLTYEAGSRGPAASDALIADVGFVRTQYEYTKLPGKL